MQNNFQKYFFFTILFLGFFGMAAKAHAADFYVAQTAAGGNTGTDCANAHAVTWFNTSGNWNNPKVSVKIGTGDTSHLCGTITDTLTIQESGSSGSSITILFETGAKMSKAAWGTLSSGAIYSSGKNYIAIDGGTNGKIENTDNGTGLGNQVDSYFIYAMGNPSHWEIKNLALANMYMRTEGTEDNEFGYAIYMGGILTDISIHDCIIHDGRKMVYLVYYGGASSNIQVYNNSFDDGVVDLTVGSGNTNSALDTVLIHDNTFHRGLKWSGQPAIHTDEAMIYTAHAGTTIVGLKVYNNTFSGQCGTNSSAFLYFSAPPGTMTDSLAFNNTFSYDADVGSCGDGMIYLKTNTGTKIYNNTFYSASVDSQQAILMAVGSGIIIENNILGLW